MLKKRHYVQESKSNLGYVITNRFFTYDSGLASIKKLSTDIREHMTEDVSDILSKTMTNCEKSAKYTSKMVEEGFFNPLDHEELISFGIPQVFVTSLFQQPCRVFFHLFSNLYITLL